MYCRAGLRLDLLELRQRTPFLSALGCLPAFKCKSHTFQNARKMYERRALEAHSTGCLFDCAFQRSRTVARAATQSKQFAIEVGATEKTCRENKGPAHAPHCCGSKCKTRRLPVVQNCAKRLLAVRAICLQGMFILGPHHRERSFEGPAPGVFTPSASSPTSHGFPLRTEQQTPSYSKKSCRSLSESRHQDEFFWKKLVALPTSGLKFSSLTGLAGAAGRTSLAPLRFTTG